MNAFLVDLENKPGALATVAEALAAKGVNITGVTGAASGTGSRVAITTADDATARTTLRDKNISFKEMEATETTLRDEPGSLAKVTRRLADAGVNIEAMLPTGMSGRDVSIAFVTDNPTKARDAFATTSSTVR
jgi:hypothetical protein